MQRTEVARLPAATFNLQDMFNASDNLAEHFEFLDQQPKVFPGWAKVLTHRAQTRVLFFTARIEAHIMVQFKGVLFLRRYHLPIQPDQSRSLIVDQEFLEYYVPGAC